MKKALTALAGLVAMLAASVACADAPPASTPAPAPVVVAAPAPRVVERVVEKKVYVPRTTYVYSSPSYGYSSSSTYCSHHRLYDSCGRYTPSYYSSYRTVYPRFTYSSRHHHGSSYRRAYYGRSSCYPRSGLSLSWGW